MYVDILSSALDDWVSDLGGPDLLDYALLCRDELRLVAPPRGGSAYTALAAEIAYDRALIALCTERGIDAHATSFAYPRAERQRIEMVLKHEGLDLDSPRKRKTRALVSPWMGSDRLADEPRNGGTAAEDGNTPPALSKGTRSGAPAAALVEEASEVSVCEASDEER
jgi:hypothetical protein